MRHYWLWNVLFIFTACLQVKAPTAGIKNQLDPSAFDGGFLKDTKVIGSWLAKNTEMFPTPKSASKLAVTCSEFVVFRNELSPKNTFAMGTKCEVASSTANLKTGNTYFHIKYAGSVLSQNIQALKLSSAIVCKSSDVDIFKVTGEIQYALVKDKLTFQNFPKFNFSRKTSAANSSSALSEKNIHFGCFLNPGEKSVPEFLEDSKMKIHDWVAK